MDRSHFLMYEIRSLVFHSQIPDKVLREKVEAEVKGRVLRHDAIQVQVMLGKVHLYGTAREVEIQGLVKKIAAMRGVKGVLNNVQTLTPPFISWDDAEWGSGSGSGSRAPSHFLPGSLLKSNGRYSGLTFATLAVTGVVLSLVGFKMRGISGAVLVSGGAAIFGAAAAFLLPRSFSQKNGT